MKNCHLKINKINYLEVDIGLQTYVSQNPLELCSE